MELHTVLAFWAVAVLFILTPGMDWACAISAGIRGHVVVPAVAGMMFGHLTDILIVAAGLGALLSSNPLLLSVITLLGAIYLLWMGAGLIRHPAIPSAGTSESMDSWKQWLTRGACVSGLNPKVFLLLFALLPQFVVPTSPWPTGIQILALGIVHIVTCGAVYLLVGYTAQSVLKSRPEGARIVSRLSGVLMIVIGLLLLFEQVQAL